MQDKTRLDTFLFEQGKAPSREKARALIQAGLVRVNGQSVDKPATMLKESDQVELQGKEHPFVSRGGLKLAKAFDVFPIDVQDKVCVDIGASTGGFTDCLLQHGAKKVYAIDVGYGQLDWGLRNDERVCSMERQNARYMLPDWFDEKPGFACMDLAFISIRLILKPLYQCLDEEAEVIALIKPQFEAGRENVGKKGVVRDAKVHQEVIEGILAFARENRYGIKGLDFSPITGPQGNIEFLLYLSKTEKSEWDIEEDAEKAENISLLAKNSLTKNA